MSALSPNVVSETGDAPSDSKAENPLLFVARMENARVIYTLLSTLYFGKRTECVVTASICVRLPCLFFRGSQPLPSPHSESSFLSNFKQMNIVISSKGLKCTIEHARSVQGNAVLDASLFEEYHYNSSEEKEELAVPLAPLLDVLSVFGTFSNNVTVEFGYKSYGGPLVLLLNENDVLTDAGIRTLETFDTIKFDMRSAELCCRIIMRSESLNEALSELDWSSDSLTWEILSVPPYFRIFASGSGASCSIEYPRDSEYFELYDSTYDAKFQYKMKLLQPTLKALAVAKKTQIRINRLGLLSLQHMITTEDGQTSFVDFFVAPKEDIDDED